MKSKLTNRTRATVLLLIILGITTVNATTARAADSKLQTSPAPTLRAPTAIDPATGLPLPRRPPWKDPEWPDPDKVLRDVSYDALPLNIVADQLRQEFDNAFDVLIPSSWQDPYNPAVSVDPQSFTIRMRLKNVRASEVFNAMNLMFEGENTPCHWELKLNGDRPTAMLRVLPQLLPTVAPAPPPPPITRMVYFAGDLLGDEKSGGMTMEELVKTVSEVYQMSYGPPKGVLQFHKQAQLLIVTGTRDQIQFVQQTLSALREKAHAEHKPPPKLAGPKAGAEETKPR